MASHGILELRGPVAPGQSGVLVARAEALLAAGIIRELACELSGVIDLSVVDSLARLQLVARRRGVVLRISAESTEAELGSLLSYLGLADAIARDSRGG